MIRSLTISNFRSVGEEVTLELGDFTVLVGTNGSGKSNVVGALRFVADAVTIGLSGAVTQWRGIGAVRRWSGGHPFDLSIALTLQLAGGHAGYSLRLTGDRADEYRVKSEEADLVSGGEGVGFSIADGEWRRGPQGLRPPLDPQSLALQLVGGDARFQPLVHALQKLAVYSIFPDTLRAPQKYDPRKPMDRHGSNWSSILKDQPKESWKSELITALQQLTGDIEDVRIRQAAGYLVTEFRHASTTTKQKWFTTAQESDGTLRFAGIVTALLQEPALPVVGVEEPELTVHPGAIPLLHDYLRQASKRSQVIVTTHSPDLLDLVAAEDVRVVVREDGVTSVAPMSDDQRDVVRDGLLSLGEVLRTEGLRPQRSLAFGTP